RSGAPTCLTRNQSGLAGSRSLHNPLLAAIRPNESHGDIAGLAVGKDSDFGSQLVALFAEMPFVELVNFSRHPGQRSLPALLALVDGAPAVGAKLVWESINLNFCPAIFDRAFNHREGSLDRLLIGHARRIAQLIQEF